ncbi:MAG: acetyltransferase family protein [Massilia sp.]|nr:acetyltransferase family protein [Massilia sp.]
MSTQLSIRRARPGDEDALALVGQATFLETFAGILDGAAIVEHCRRAHAATQYRDWLADADAAIWLAETTAGNAPVGYVVVARPQLPGADAARDLELKRIYLLGRYHGGGAGKRLLEQAVEFAAAAGAARLLLGVYAGNEAAIGFYRRHGFTHLTERQFNVGGRLYDDHVLSLALPPSGPDRVDGCHGRNP